MERVLDGSLGEWGREREEGFPNEDRGVLKGREEWLNRGVGLGKVTFVQFDSMIVINQCNILPVSQTGQSEVNWRSDAGR